MISRHGPRILVIAAALAGLSAWPAPASAGFLLDARYTGVVVSISDTYGIFGPVALGDSIGGVIQYPTPTQPPYYGDPTNVYYDFPVTPGGDAQMTANLGSLNVRATSDLNVALYNRANPKSPGDSIYGYDFQFNDGDVSLLRTAGLPAGYHLGYLDADVGLISTDPSRIGFPNLPSSLLPLEQYDSYFTGGALSVDILDASGRYIDGAFIEFQLTSVASAVPEPSSALLTALALPLIAAWARWRRPGRDF